MPVRRNDWDELFQREPAPSSRPHAALAGLVLLGALGAVVATGNWSDELPTGPPAVEAPAHPDATAPSAPAPGPIEVAAPAAPVQSPPFVAPVSSSVRLDTASPAPARPPLTAASPPTRPPAPPAVTAPVRLPTVTMVVPDTSPDDDDRARRAGRPDRGNARPGGEPDRKQDAKQDQQQGRGQDEDRGKGRDEDAVLRAAGDPERAGHPGRGPGRR